MYRAISAFGLMGVLATILGGCPLSPQGSNNNSVGSTVGDVTRPRVIPALPSASVTVQVINQTGFPARIDVRMELAGSLVRQAVRTIGANASPVTIGSDRTDFVELRAIVLAEDTVALPIDVRRLDRDFEDGDIVTFVLQLGVETDCNENGIDDSFEADRDEDGVIDDCDGCPDDANKVLPGLCGCGVDELDTDEDGTPDCNDACPEDPAKTAPGACGCGTSDSDSDEDGTPDCEDGCPDDSLKVAPGACGCGTADLDRDEDGTPDCNDGCPEDPAKIAPGDCGCGEVDLDHNENGISDCLEMDDATVTLLDLDQNQRVGRFATVVFRVLLENVEPTDTLRVLFVKTAGNDEPFTVFESTENADALTISVPLADIDQARYRVFAYVLRNETTIAEDVSAGTIYVNIPPSVAILAPDTCVLLQRGQTTTVVFEGSDPDDQATIRLLLDTNQQLDGEELVLVDGLPESGGEPHAFDFDPDGLKLPDGDYYVAAQIDDTFDIAVDYSAKITVTSRRLGAIETNSLPPQQRHMLRGSLPNFQFGFAVDMSHDMDGDQRADLLVGDPRFVRTVDGDDFDLGAAQLFLTTREESGDSYSFPDTASGADTTFFGEFTLQRAGSAVAMIDSVNGDAIADFLIGGPFFSFGTGALMGRGYLADGAFAITRKFFLLCCEGFPRVSYFEGELEDFAGKDVAGLRDVGGDQIPDFAFGAAHPGGIGVVTVLAGGAPHPSGSLAARGYQLFGTRINGQFGSEIASCPDTDGDGRSEIAIGEPGPLGGGYELAGCVHLVYGDPSFDGEDKSLLGGKETLRRRTFIGASSGDAFGHAIECADFDCDGKTDLIVGAPGANGGAGATYIIYNIANPDLPDVVSIADLGTPSLPGAILSGQHEGDQLGFALTIASDFDGDQKIDLIIGAPGTGSNRGSAWFVYGGLRPEGEVELTSDSCAFQAFELFPSSATVGTDGTGGTVPRAQLFGYSLSSGDATNNGRSDVVIGSPGFNNRGAVYIIDGASNAELPH